MAEKYLKGFLTFHKKSFRKSHELGELLERCKDIDKEFTILKDDCDFLTRYYIPTRYPGDLAEGISESEAKEAFERAIKIKEFILKRIKLR